jgi:hypothetical protein
VYSLTPEGERVLRERRAAWRRFAESGTAVLDGS